MLMTFSVAFSLSLLCAISLYQARAYINRFVRRSDIQARQASHINPTLRLGGFGVAVGIFSSVPIMGDEARFFVYLALSSLPLVVVGFLEDIGIHQSARIRLVMAFVAGALVMLSLGLGVTRVGIPLLDPILGLFPVFVAFTLFTTAGVVHAFNIIDGLHGLAGANALMITGSLICISFMSGDYSTVHPLIVVLGSVLGFLLLNYPSGRLFLGDAGAYLVGFLLVWMAVHLLVASPKLSPWAILLVFFWPVADTIMAIYRRNKSGVSPARPDRLHAHHVVMRGFEISILGRRARSKSNPLATAALVPFLLFPPLMGLAFWDKPAHAAITTSVLALIFVVSYFGLVTVLRRMRSRRIVGRRVSGGTVGGEAVCRVAKERYYG